VIPWDGQYCPSYLHPKLTENADGIGMTNYRRLRIPGATYFFTLCLEDRDSTLLIDHIDTLRAAYAMTLRELPADCSAIVILPDHLHSIWTEPEGQVLFSERWRRIKARFSHAVKQDFRPNPSKSAKRERGLWQRRFWEHAIRNEAEFVAAMDYCYRDPMEHGLVEQPEDWKYSSFFRGMGDIAHPTHADESRDQSGDLPDLGLTPLRGLPILTAFSPCVPPSWPRPTRPDRPASP
jgi:putative transposase